MEKSILRLSKVEHDEVIRLAQDGDRDAFGALYEIHKLRVYRICFKIVRDPTKTEDLVQDVFLHLLEHLKSFRGESQFTTWLHRVAINFVLMRLHGKKNKATVSLDSLIETPEGSMPQQIACVDTHQVGAIDRISLDKAMLELPFGYHNVFYLHDIEQYEHHEIAKILDCSVGNSKSQLHRARALLRKKLTRQPDKLSTLLEDFDKYASDAPEER